MPEFTDIFTASAVGVGAGVPVRGGRERGHSGVGGVGVGPAPAGEREHAADSEARGAGAGGRTSQGATLRGCVASPVEIIGATASCIREPDNVEYPLAGDREYKQRIQNTGDHRRDSERWLPQSGGHVGLYTGGR